MHNVWGCSQQSHIKERTLCGEPGNEASADARGRLDTPRIGCTHFEQRGYIRKC